jgi:hypothetical protein
MQVTPGFGASVATELKSNAHHQRVITHGDLVRSQVIPAVSAVTYSDGQCIGGELTFAGVARLAGDVALVESVEIVLRNLAVPADLDVILYPDNLADTPVNGEMFTLADAEVQAIQGIVRIPASAFTSVDGKHFAAVAPATPLLIEAASGVSSIRGVVVARGAVELPNSGGIIISLVARRS